MSGLNKVIIIGNLGRDPETKTLDTSTICNLSVATSRKYKSKSGEDVEETEWHRVSVFGKLAETCSRYLSKGRTVCVEGRLRTRQWEKDGEKRYATEIVAESVQFLGGSQGSKPSGPSAGPNPVDDELPF